MTAAAFCRAQGVCPKYFSLRKKALGAVTEAVAVAAEPSPFVRVVHERAHEVGAGFPRVNLRIGRCDWELSGFALDDLARLMTALG